ncbi:hypothetical protein GCM10009570_17860 [Dietzia natronolimnaea]
MLIRVIDEPFDLLDAGIDGLEPEVAAELLVAPSLQHLCDGLFLGMQRPDSTDEIGASNIVNRHRHLQAVSHLMHQ